MSSIGNNISGKLANMRDSFFGLENGEILTMDGNAGNGEAQKLIHLLKTSASARECFYMCKNNLTETELTQLAEERITLVETGQVPDKDMDRVESELCLILGAVVDMEKIREKERTRQYEEAMER